MVAAKVTFDFSQVSWFVVFLCNLLCSRILILWNHVGLHSIRHGNRSSWLARLWYPPRQLQFWVQVCCSSHTQWRPNLEMLTNTISLSIIQNYLPNSKNRRLIPGFCLLIPPFSSLEPAQLQVDEQIFLKIVESPLAYGLRLREFCYHSMPLVSWQQIFDRGYRNKSNFWWQHTSSGGYYTQNIRNMKTILEICNLIILIQSFP